MGLILLAASLHSGLIALAHADLAQPATEQVEMRLVHAQECSSQQAPSYCDITCLCYSHSHYLLLRALVLDGLASTPNIRAAAAASSFCCWQMSCPVTPSIDPACSFRGDNSIEATWACHILCWPRQCHGTANLPCSCGTNMLFLGLWPWVLVFCSLLKWGVDAQLLASCACARIISLEEVEDEDCSFWCHELSAHWNVH